MKDIFKKYWNAVISPEEFKQLSAFVMKEENTGAVYQMMKPEWDKTMEAKPESHTEKSRLFQQIIRQILQDEASNSSKKAKIYLISLRIAAVLVIGLLFSSIWFYIQSRNLNAVTEQIQTVSIPYGAKTRLVMPDNSTVWLNSGSALSYSSDFSKKREVVLKGEAFFDVQKGKIPFEVITDFGKIRVLGTAFNVLAFPETGFVTTLERGSVRIDSENCKQQLMMEPGDQVELVNDNLVKSKVETKLFTSWKDGEMIFKREPFPTLMKRLERWFNVKIEYSQEDFKGLWYSGTIGSETITEVMDMISEAAPVISKYNSKTRIIKVVPRR
jgi:transmembrane sensor